MHSIRRAVAKAAWSSSMAVAAHRQVGSSIVRASTINMQPAIALPLSRYFSQTVSAGQVLPRVSFESRQADDLAAREGRALFIANMSYDATDEHLFEAFNKYGEIVNAHIAKDGRGLSRGFGFITFKEPEAASRAIVEANDTYWHGRRILVKEREPKEIRQKFQFDKAGAGVGQRASTPPNTSVYVGNIPYETTDAELNKMFRSLENVVDVRVAVDRHTGWPRGFAHADFTDVESATKALEYLSTQSLGGRQLRVDYGSPRTLKPRDDQFENGRSDSQGEQSSQGQESEQGEDSSLWGNTPQENDIPRN